MNANEYQKMSQQFNDGRSTERLLACFEEYGLQEVLSEQTGNKVDLGELLHARDGMSGESGEVADLLKKWIFHEKEPNAEHLKKEIGDVLWYVALACHSMGWQMEDVMLTNYNKLNERYNGGGFSTNLANNRKHGDI